MPRENLKGLSNEWDQGTKVPRAVKIIKALSKNASAAGQGAKVPRAMKAIKALSTNDSGQGTKVPRADDP